MGRWGDGVCVYLCICYSLEPPIDTECYWNLIMSDGNKHIESNRNSWLCFYLDVWILLATDIIYISDVLRIKLYTQLKLRSNKVIEMEHTHNSHEIKNAYHKYYTGAG